jgi:hypothetical protein
MMSETPKWRDIPEMATEFVGEDIARCHNPELPT